MKILCIANVRLPVERAYGVAMMRQCEAFAQLGNDVVLAYANRNNPLKEELFAYYGMSKTFRIQTLNLLDVNALGRVGLLLLILSFLPSTLWCVLREKPDVIYTRDDFTGFFLSLFFKNVVWEVHSARATPHLCVLRNRASAVVYISNGLKSFYTEKCRKNAKKEIVAPSAILPELFTAVSESKKGLRKKFGVSEEKKVVGYIGKFTTMGEGKGVDVLIDAFGLVYKQDKEAFLLLVGMDAGEVEMVKEKITQQNIPTTAYALVEHIAQKEVSRYMRMCDCLVLCYPNMEHYRLYMSPIKLFEYMASGVPIVSTDLPSVREIVDETIVSFVKPGDVNDMGRGIKKVLGNTEESRARAQKAQEEVIDKYTWHKRAQFLKEFFIELGNCD